MMATTATPPTPMPTSAAVLREVLDGVDVGVGVDVPVVVAAAVVPLEGDVPVPELPVPELPVLVEAGILVVEVTVLV